MCGVITPFFFFFFFNSIWEMRQTRAGFSFLEMVNTELFTFQELVQGFDQETAAVVMARKTSLKMETEVFSINSLF